MKLYRLLIIFLLIQFYNFSKAQQSKILTAEKHNEYGLIYTLPVTAFEVEVVSERQIKKAGPFYQYAKKYVGTDKVVKEDAETWIIKEVNIKPYGIPDPDSRYLMQLKPGAVTYIAVDKDGMLLAINETPEVINEEVSVKSSIPSGTSFPEDFLKYVGEDYMAAQSSAKRAQILAEELMEVRDSKVSLARGTADVMPTDGRQLELMLNSLENQEAALMAAFTGSVSTETIIRKFNFIPEKEGRTILFRMSDFAGPVEANNYAGAPVYMDVKIVSEGELPVDSKGEEKKMPKDAVAYCVPGSARLSLSYRGEQLASKEFDVAQFGIIFGLNPSLFTDKKDPSFAIFDPTTGAVKEIGKVKE